ncbi:DHA2 family efflux MFS transporter permease subunit [Periweissella cryptocerci]|uniref:DHA2 family efflux MFS transporter permease subunit n=1 Tax=Periweissella cryptocerci TaxID=2506420 RepID=A0A4P6YVS2_9LACO|nr:MDR family MFS transporter [Periweissella cryptocerci]QBO36853.1 DHA2 family efflux MFS transporter permease subunit [Periweissella cryptocerci]
MAAQTEKKLNLTWIFIPLSLILFMSTLDQTITTTALDGIVKDLGHLNQSAWIITGFMLTSAVMTLIFGKLGDIFGRKIILQIALAIFILGSLFSGLAHSMLFLIIARTFQGIGAGGLNSLVQAVTADVVPARTRGKYQALFGLISMVSLIAGPILGGYFVQYASWQWIFFINIPIGVIASVILAIKLHLPSRANVVTKIDYLGSVFVTTFTALTLLIVTLGGEQVAWHSAKMFYMIIGAVVSLIAYLIVEHRMQKDALTPLPLFKNLTFNNASLQFALATAALFVAMVFIPMYAQMIHHVSASHSGYYIIPTMIAMIIATMVGGAIIERTGKYKLLPIIGAVLLGVGFYGLAQISLNSANWFIILWQIPVGLGVGLFVQVAMLAGQNTVPVRDLGTATGVLNFFKTLGGAFGAAAFGVILTNDMGTHLANPIHAFQTVFIWTIPIAVVLLILAVFLKEEPLSEEVLAYED